MADDESSTIMSCVLLLLEVSRCDALQSRRIGATPGSKKAATNSIEAEEARDESSSVCDERDKIRAGDCFQPRFLSRRRLGLIVHWRR